MSEVNDVKKSYIVRPSTCHSHYIAFPLLKCFCMSHGPNKFRPEQIILTKNNLEGVLGVVPLRHPLYQLLIFLYTYREQHEIKFRNL